MKGKFRRDSIIHGSKKVQLPNYEGEEKSQQEIAKIREKLGVQVNRHERNRRERRDSRG